jgi:hypothetical protein
MQKTHLKVPYVYEQKKFDDAPHTPWKIQMWVRKWKQRKKELRYTP